MNEKIEEKKTASFSLLDLYYEIDAYLKYLTDSILEEETGEEGLDEQQS